MEMGAELLELDVHSTVDGHLIVHHDFDLKRTTGAATSIGELIASDLGSIDVGAWKGTHFAGEHLPTLDAVLQRYGNSALLNVEIKVGDHPYAEIEARVAKLIRRHDLIDRVVVSSFDLETVLRLRRLEPQIRVSLLFEAKESPIFPVVLHTARRLDSVLAISADLGAVGVHVKHSLIDAGVKQNADALGLGLLAWTVDDEPEMRRLAALGIDAIVSNIPDRLHRVLMSLRRTEADQAIHWQ